MFLLLLTVLSTYIVVRYFFWYFFEKGKDFTADGYYTMMCIKEYKKNNHKRFGNVPNMIIPLAHVYPSIGIWVLSFFPENMIYKFGGLLNTFIDSFFLIAICVSLFYLKVNIPVIMFVSLIFIFLPTLYNKTQ